MLSKNGVLAGLRHIAILKICPFPDAPTFPRSYLVFSLYKVWIGRKVLTPSGHMNFKGNR